MFSDEKPASHRATASRTFSGTAGATTTPAEILRDKSEGFHFFPPLFSSRSNASSAASNTSTWLIFARNAKR